MDFSYELGTKGNGGVDFGDKRRKNRLIKLVSDLSQASRKSIPQVSQGWAETKAAYRFLGNEAVSWQEILSGHSQSTIERAQKEKIILCLQDTTELDFSSHPSAVGLGRLNYDARKGMYLHPTLWTTPEGYVLGAMDAWMWARSTKGEEEFKESIRWIEGYQRVAEMAEQLPESKLVYVADREGDLRELMEAARTANYAADFLLRAKHNRKLDKSEEKCWEQVERSGAIGKVEFTLPSSGKRKSRKVCQTLYVKRITLAGKNPIEVTAILAKEENPPANTKAIEWKLLTNRRANTLEEVVELIDWYRRRWQIEIFFRVLKSGCKAESMQLAEIKRIEKLLVIYMIIAWRILYLVTMGKECPDLPCDVIFDKEEWTTAWLVSKQEKPPEKPPKLGEIVRIIAIFGGFLDRKGDSSPGAKAIWEGMEMVRNYAVGVETAKAVFKLGI